MKNKIILAALVLLVPMLWNCGGFTRVDEDIYTISHRDTTTKYFMKNAPDNEDKGLVYPSSRTFKSERYLLQEDSIVTRHYPDFIRLGIFESVGLFVGGDADYAMGSGMFGIFHEFDQDPRYFRGSPDYTFTGGIYRLGVGEWRLRWFRDAANWTYGTSAVEAIFPDARLERALIGVAPLYLRKRWFLREEIPYVCVTAATGASFIWPSQYVNASASLDIGSIAGFNIRAYVGFAAGQNSNTTPQVRESQYTDEAQSVTMPYAGIGISFLDFMNIVPETYMEWKDHPHSGWDIGILQAGFIGSGAASSIFSDEDESSLFNGTFIRLLNAEAALPFANNKFYVGSSLFNCVVLGNNEWGCGVLPIRFGYWETVLADELSLSPFVEYNYYPSNFFNVGAKMSLRITPQLNIGVIAGFASGSTDENIGNQLTNGFGQPGDFSGAYFGIMLGLFDNIFFPEQLRYNREELR